MGPTSPLHRVYFGAVVGHPPDSPPHPSSRAHRTARTRTGRPGIPVRIIGLITETHAESLIGRETGKYDLCGDPVSRRIPEAAEHFTPVFRLGRSRRSTMRATRWALRAGIAL